MLLVYDFEVFKEDWCCVIANMLTKEVYEFVNDPDGLTEFYNDHAKNHVFCGFNNVHYDDWILRSIIAGYNPKEMNDWIIDRDLKPQLFDDTLARQYPMYSFDIYVANGGGLKKLEAFMGDDIRETTVPFDIDRKLTAAEMEEVLFYCRHDVSETIRVMAYRKAEFDAIFSLIKEFDLTLDNFNKTKPQISAKILGCVSQEFDDEWDFTHEDTVRIEKYTNVLEWFNEPKNRFIGAALDVNIAGVPHTFAWGGCHGAIPNYIKKSTFINVDVASYYPTLMLEYDLMSRTPQFKDKFRMIYDTRLALKAAGKKAEQAPYKIILNSTYGASGDKFNPLYDPRQAHRVCLNGQLMLLDLIERCEDLAVVIQSNTDGVLFEVEPKNRDEFMRRCDEWSKRTRMPLEFEDYAQVVQRDVNNYIIVPEGPLYDEKGKPRWKAKGKVVKMPSILDCDCAIISMGVTDYFLEGVSAKNTVRNNRYAGLYQIVYNRSDKYNHVYHGCTFTDATIELEDVKGVLKKSKVKIWNGDGCEVKEKINRVFASKNKNGALYKGKDDINEKTGLPVNPQKYANCPVNCEIHNESLVGKKIDDIKDFDESYYIKRIEEEIRGFEVGKKVAKELSIVRRIRSAKNAAT